MNPDVPAVGATAVAWLADTATVDRRGRSLAGERQTPGERFPGSLGHPEVAA